MSWLSSFRRFRGRGSPSKVVPVDPLPPPPPEPSCLAKGIALSLVTEGDDGWDRVSSAREGWIPVPLLHVEHHVHGIRIIAFPAKDHPYATREPLPGCERIASVMLQDQRQRAENLTEAEQTLIARAIESKPLGLFKLTLDAEAAARVKEAASTAHFTKLGCPTS